MRTQQGNILNCILIVFFATEIQSFNKSFTCHQTLTNMKSNTCNISMQHNYIYSF